MFKKSLLLVVVLSVQNMMLQGILEPEEAMKLPREKENFLLTNRCYASYAHIAPNKQLEAATRAHDESCIEELIQRLKRDPNEIINKEDHETVLFIVAREARSETAAEGKAPHSAWSTYKTLVANGAEEGNSYCSTGASQPGANKKGWTARNVFENLHDTDQAVGLGFTWMSSTGKRIHV
jgi:hypothetical protein